MTIRKYVFLAIFYLLARKAPSSKFPILGPICKQFRYFCCKRIFRHCGIGVNIERNAYFGNGFEVEIGNYSGIGERCSIPSNIKIGSYVMMAPDVIIHKNNHEFKYLDRPMALQGVKESDRVIIGDDVWIGQRAIINPGRRVSDGTIIATGTVLVKNCPPFSIVGGNPSRIIGSRLRNSPEPSLI